MEPVEQLSSWLSTPRRIAITTHQRPDGDAMGSSLGLYHYLVKKGHRVKVVVPTDYGENLKWIPGTEDVLIGPNDVDVAKWTFDGADLIFCLDFNSLARINDLGPIVEDTEGKKIMIDHHLDPVGFEDLAYWDDTASSTAEMVYRLITELGDADMIDLPIAQALYTGVMTDTGSFRFSSTSPAVHRMIAHLLETGVETHKIHDALYSNASESRLRFLGHCFTNCLFVLPELRTAYIKVEKPVFKEFNVKAGETEGLVNYALGIKGIRLATLITTQDNIVKLSFRSRDDFAANEFAANFGGGGHFYAAGGKSTTSLEETEQKFLDLLEQYKDKLLAE